VLFPRVRPASNLDGTPEYRHGQHTHRKFSPEAPRRERGEVRGVHAEERPADAHLHRPAGPGVPPRAHEPGTHVRGSPRSATGPTTSRAIEERLRSCSVNLLNKPVINHSFIGCKRVIVAWPSPTSLPHWSFCSFLVLMRRCQVFSTSGCKTRDYSLTPCVGFPTQPCLWPRSSALGTNCPCSSGGRRRRTMVGVVRVARSVWQNQPNGQ